MYRPAVRCIHRRTIHKIERRAAIGYKIFKLKVKFKFVQSTEMEKSFSRRLGNKRLIIV